MRLSLSHNLSPTLLLLSDFNWVERDSRASQDVLYRLRAQVKSELAREREIKDYAYSTEKRVIYYTDGSSIVAVDDSFRKKWAPFYIYVTSDMRLSTFWWDLSVIHNRLLSTIVRASNIVSLAVNGDTLYYYTNSGDVFEYRDGQGVKVMALTPGIESIRFISGCTLY